MVTNYRFQPYTSPLKEESSKERARENVKDIVELMDWSEKYLKHCDNGAKLIYRNYVKRLRYNSSCLRSEATGVFRKGGEVQLRAPLGENGKIIVVNDK